MKMDNGCSKPEGLLGQTSSLSKEVVILHLVSKSNDGMSAFTNWWNLLEYVYTCYTWYIDDVYLVLSGVNTDSNRRRGVQVARPTQVMSYGLTNYDFDVSQKP